MSEWKRIERLNAGRRLINDVFMSADPAYGFGVFWVDMEEAHAFVQHMKQEQQTALTYLHLFIRACGMALSKYPDVNAMLDGSRRIFHPAGADIAVSVAGTTNYAPVVHLKSVEKKDLVTLARELREGTEKARAEEEAFLLRIHRVGRLLPFQWLRRGLIRLFLRSARLRRSVAGTFQISSLPEEIMVPFRLLTTALMGIGKVRERPAVVDGKVVPRKSVYICVPVDHRTVDGKVPMHFVEEVIRLVENPELMMQQPSGSP